MCIIIAKSIGKCCSLVYFEVGVVLERVCRKIQSFIECEDSDDWNWKELILLIN